MARTRPKYRQMTEDDAETLGIEALSFIAADGAALKRFLGITGYDPAAIREHAGSREFLAGVLEFLLGDESLLLVFASHKSIDPSQVGLARRALASGQGNQD